MIPMIKLIVVFALVALAAEVGVLQSGEATAIVPEILHITRYLFATVLLGLFVYLSVIRSPDGRRIPARYRAALLTLAFLIFDLAREGSVMPGVSRDVVAIAIYSLTLTLILLGFLDVSRLYDIPRPREGIPKIAVAVREDIRELREDIRRLRQ